MSRNVIFDIDGCLRDDSWRLRLIDHSKTDDEHGEKYKLYHELQSHDENLVRGMSFLEKHCRRGDDIFFITARPVYLCNQTHQTIRSMLASIGFAAYRYNLFMREANEEGVPSPELKEAILNRIGLPFHEAYDDRRDVCEMYAANGIKAYQLDRNDCKPIVRIQGVGYDVGSGDSCGLTLVGSIKMPIFTPHACDNMCDCESQTSLGDSLRAFYAQNPFPPSKDDIERIHVKMTAAAAERNAADVLAEAAETFRERNAIYKDNAKVVGKVMLALFPHGVRLDTPEDYHIWHLFELAIVKLTRFACSGLTHTDSAHDSAVYWAMLELLVDTHNVEFR